MAAAVDMTASPPLHLRNPPPSSPIRRWIRQSPLGHGSFARVSLALNLEDGLLFAVKSASVSSPSAPELLAIESELSILQSLHSPHILSFLGSDFSSDNGVPSRNIFLEYMEGGSIADIARNAEGGRLDEGRLKRFTRSIVEGLVYLHEREIVHCDIKGRNILIGSSGVKIADFGAARRIREPQHVSGKRLEGEASQKRLSKPDEASEKRHNCDHAIENRPRSRKSPAKRLRFDQLTVERISSNQEDAAEQPSCAGSSERIPVLKGTPLWMAPEVLQGVEQGLPSDIWSLGCTVVEMAQGSPPWTNALEADASLEQLMFKIACTEEDLPLPPSLSDECQDFLSKCLQRDPRLRWSAPDLLRHPFLVSEDASSSDHLSFQKQPQSSPRSTLDFAVSGRESHDGDDDRCSDELQDDESWQCGFPSSSDEDRSKLRSLNQNSVALYPPPVAIPQDCIWIAVRCLDEDVVMNQDEEANTLLCLPFMTDSSAMVVQKGCEVNLDCASFLLKRRVRKVAS